jgi:hypothetical protein
MAEHETRIITQILGVLNILHQGVATATIKLYVHSPHILQQVAPDLGRLLTTYVTPFYINYN